MISRKKTTVYLDPDLLRAVKVRAAEEGKHDYGIFEEALRAYLTPVDHAVNQAVLRAMMDRLAIRNEPMDDDEAMKLANEELHAMRAERRQR